MSASTSKPMASPFESVLPKALKVGKDKIMLRLDFYSEAIVMQDMEKDGGDFRMVSARDVTQALASQLSFSSGLLPENCLWWSSGNKEAVVAIWTPPQVRRLALQREATGRPERYDVPLPGLIFLCRPGMAPSVFACNERPTGPKDKVYKAPLANVYDNGTTCGGNNRFPANVAEIPDSFFRSFFTPHADIAGRSKLCPNDVTKLWKKLDGKKDFPLSDLVYHGTVADLMGMAK